MKKTTILKTAGIIPAALFLLSSCVLKQEEPKQPRTITVNATGKVTVPNDRAIITFSVISRNADVIRAVDENSRKMTSVQEALAEKSISKEDISTDAYSIRQDSSYSNGRLILGQFEVSNRITVTVKDALKAGEIIDAAVKHGANSLSSLEYTASPSQDSTKQARILAVKNAESVANTMATAAGAKLGEVITINELWSSGVQRYSALEEAKADGFTSSALSSPGSSAITVQIQATYALEQ